MKRSEPSRQKQNNNMRRGNIDLENKRGEKRKTTWREKKLWGPSVGPVDTTALAMKVAGSWLDRWVNWKEREREREREREKRIVVSTMKRSCNYFEANMRAFHFISFRFFFILSRGASGWQVRRPLIPPRVPSPPAGWRFLPPARK